MASTQTHPAPRSAPRPSRPSVSGPTRERLIDCAGPIFADRGFRAATIREISAAAGENVAAIHYHFGDKLGLYTHVVLRSTSAAQLDAMRTAFDQQGPPEQVLRGVIRARLQSLNRRDLPAWQFRILMHELAEPTPALAQLVHHAGRPLFTRLLELIGSMIDLLPTAEKTRLCAISVMGQILAYVFAAPLLAGVWPELKMTPAQVERIAQHIGDFSLAYIQPFRESQSAAQNKTHAAHTAPAAAHTTPAAAHSASPNPSAANKSALARKRKTTAAAAKPSPPKLRTTLPRTAS